MADSGHAADLTATMDYQEALGEGGMPQGVPMPHPEDDVDGYMDGLQDAEPAGGYGDDTDDDGGYEDDDAGGDYGDDDLQAVAAATFGGTSNGKFPHTTLRETQDRLRREAVRAHIDECDTEITMLQRQIAATQASLKEAEAARTEACNALDTADPHPTLVASTIAPHHMAAKVKEWNSHNAKLEKQKTRATNRAEELYTSLDRARDALAQAELSLSRFGTLAGELEDADALDAKTTTILGYARANDEYATAKREVAGAKRALQHNIRAEARALERAKQTELAATAARAAVMPLMQASLKKVGDRNQLAARAAQQEDGRRINAVIALKEHRDTSLAKDRRVTAARERRGAKEKEVEAFERAQILAEGGNPDAVFLQRKRQAEVDAKQRALDEKVQATNLEMYDKLMREEQREMKKGAKKEQRPRRHSKKKAAAPEEPEVPPRTGLHDQTIIFGGGSAKGPGTAGGAGGPDDHPDIPDDFNDEDSGLSDAGPEDADEDEMYAQPEFDGMWEVDDGDRVVDIADTAGRRSWRGLSAAMSINSMFGKRKDKAAAPRVYSKLEQEMIADAHQKQKDNIIQTQVVAGRTFEGVPFSAKPETVVFSDFDVGKVYRQKIVLTNVSYGSNSFHLLPTPADFIDYEYTPSGGVSPGMTTELTVVFTPRVNEDAELALSLLASTGAFSIPLRCNTKKCLATQSEANVHFGELIIGESLTKTVTLTNTGALATNFRLAPVAAAAGGVVLLQEAPSAAVFALEFGGKTGASAVEGVLEGHTSKSVLLRYSPSAVGNARAVYDLKYSVEDMADGTLVLSGQCLDSPVFLEEPHLDFKICKINHTYCGAVVVKNRGTATTARVSFDVPKAVRKYITIAPRAGSVPPQSQLKAMVTFNPAASMRTACAAFAADGDDSAFTIPVTVKVEGQAKPCVLDITTRITQTGIELSATSFNFGDVSIYDSAVAKLTLTNTSDLPQRFGFVGVPDVLALEPGRGFGELLPRETLTLDAVFSPQPLPDAEGDCKYKFSIACKWCDGPGGSAKVSCSGVGVTPMVRLNRASVRFTATAAGDVARSDVTVTNISQKPQRFEFVPPVDSMVQMAPLNGSLRVGETRRIKLTYKPDARMFEEEEATESGCKAAEEAEAAEAANAKAEAPKAKTTKNATSTLASQAAASPADAGVAAVGAATDSLAAGGGGDTAADPAGVPADAAAGAEVAEQPEPTLGKLLTMSIPCVIQQADSLHAKSLHLIDFETRNVVNLEVEMPAVPPPLVVTEGTRSIYFPDVAVGSTAIQTVTVQNTTSREMRLSSTEMDTSGPYRISGNLRSIAPMSSKKIRVCFEPHTSGSFFDSLEVSCDLMTLKFRLTGVGIQPNLQVSTTALDLGNCMPGSTTTQSLVLSNVSPFPVTFSVRLASQDLARKWACPQEAGGAGDVGSKVPDILSLAAVPAFTCTPSQCTIAPHKQTEVQFRFAPDRVSRNWMDHAYIKLSTEKHEQDIKIFGRCWSTGAYVTGGEISQTAVGEDALSAMLPAVAVADEDEDEEAAQKKSKEAPKVAAELRRLHFDYSLSAATAVSRVVTIGMLESAAKDKLKVDYAFENLSESNLFAIDAMTGGVDPGKPKQVEIKFDPHGQDVDVSEGSRIRAKVTLNVKLSGSKSPYEFELVVSVQA